VEHEYALRLRKLCESGVADQRAVDQMRVNPAGWTLAHYEQLAHLLSTVAVDSVDSSANVGDVKQYIESVSVSSQSVRIRTLFVGGIESIHTHFAMVPTSPGKSGLFS